MRRSQDGCSPSGVSSESEPYSNTSTQVKEFCQEETESLDKPLEKEKKNEGKTSFCAYANFLCRHSLITSFPEIAERKCWLRRFIKIIIFAVCLLGFLYQTMSTVTLYYSYPTNTHVRLHTPLRVVQPAITVCNSNRYRRSVYCKAHLGRCTFLNSTEFCERHPRMCKSEADVFTWMPNLKPLRLAERKWMTAVKFAHSSKVIASCEKDDNGNQSRCEENYRVVPFTTSDGEPNLCYAIESLWGLPYEPEQTVSSRFTFRLDLNTEPEEYAIATDPVKIFLAVDDRRKLVNPHVEGYALRGGKIYNIYVSMIEYRLLLAPYETDCMDYLRPWVLNNGTGPLNRKMCIERCKLDTLLRRNACIDSSIQYPHREPLCWYKGQSFLTKENVQSCSLRCKNACYEREYDLRVEEVGDFDATCSNEWCKVSKIRVNILFNKFRLTQIVYVPKFTCSEMLFYVGCSMVIWLGVSAVSLLDLLETVLTLLFYPAARRKMARKKNFSEKDRIRHF